MMKVADKDREYLLSLSKEISTFKETFREAQMRAFDHPSKRSFCNFIHNDRNIWWMLKVDEANDVYVSLFSDLPVYKREEAKPKQVEVKPPEVSVDTSDFDSLFK